MVLASEEVSWCSSAEDDDGRHTFGEVKDRSLSYLDIHFREQLLCGKNKAFESVRKLGRPRQQQSDVLGLVDFGDPFVEDFQDNKNRYHFGQCLILPKVSTLPPKGNTNRSKRQNSPRHYVTPSRHTLGRTYGRITEGMYPSVRGFQSGVDIYGIENKMYPWTDNIVETYRKRSSVDEPGNASVKSSARTASRKDYDYYGEPEDVEAQINLRYRKDIARIPDKDEYYYHSTLENRSRRQSVVDEVVNTEARISEIRENWRLKVLRENEGKVAKIKESLERKRSVPRDDLDDDDGWEKPIERPTWNREEEKKELHRSKSTPDMLEGVGKRKLEVWNQQQVAKRNGSMMDVYGRTWEGVRVNSFKTAYANGDDYSGPSSNIYEKVYNDQQEADSLNDPNSLQEPVSSPEPPGGGKSRVPSGKNFFGQFLTSRGTTPTGDMFDNTEPFSQFWVILSNIYGQALVLLMLAFSLTEVMDNSVKLLSLQGIFLMYLYVGSIAVIICIYIWVLIDSCSSIQSNDAAAGLVPPTITTTIVPDRSADLQNLSSTKFGSLKKAHITRDRTSNTSFYLRIGAIAFGLGTLVFNGLEMAMHSMMEGSCLNDVVFVHPILHGLFTFLQMHFLFVNSQVLVERFGLAARFGFMHLAATNLALWVRLIIWESGNEWTYYVHLSQTPAGFPSSDIPTPLQLRGFPKFLVRKERDIYSGTNEKGPYQAISNEHISQVVSLHQCLNTNSLGQLWTSSMTFLYPFIIQFSIIAAAVTYIMGQNVAKDRLFFHKQKKAGGSESKKCSLPLHDSISPWGVDCSGASKGLFLGILCLVTGVVVIIIFLVVKENEDFPRETIFWLTSGTLLTILSITVIMNVVGLVQVRKLSVIGTKMIPLDKILSVVSILGVLLYTIMGIVVGASGVAEDVLSDDLSVSASFQKRHSMLLAVSIIQLLQAVMQSSFLVEAIRRTSLSRTQVLTKPARQVVTFLMFSNAVLWAFDTFVVQSWLSQELQLRFFGVLAWGVVSRIGLPLLVFFRFHSCVLLLEIWKKSYQSLHIDPGN